MTKLGKTTSLISQSGPILILHFKQVDYHASMQCARSFLPKKILTTTWKSGLQLLNIARPTRTRFYHLLLLWTFDTLSTFNDVDNFPGLSPAPQSVSRTEVQETLRKGLQSVQATMNPKIWKI